MSHLFRTQTKKGSRAVGPWFEAMEGRQLFAAVLGPPVPPELWVTGPTAGLPPALTVPAAAPVASVSLATTSAATSTTAFRSISLSSWSSAASAPSVRADASVAAVDGKMYVFGGLSDKSEVPKNRSIDVYDPKTNKWKTGVGQTPVAFSHVGTTVDGDTVYFAGGVVGKNGKRVQAVKDVWAYDVSANSWAELPDLPAERSMGSMVILDGQLNYMGGSGSNAEKESDDHYVLDLGNLSAGWKKAADLPNGRKRFGAAVVNGKIYVIGGHTGEKDRTLKSNVWMWDPAKPDSWTSKASLPSARSHIPQSVIADEWGGIIIVGGKTNSDSGSKDVLRYDPTANKWTTLKSLPTGRNSALAVLIDNTLVFSTGSSGSDSYHKETWRAAVKV